MKIGVLGTGMVGKAIADRLIELGHDVTMGSRNADGDAVTEWAAGHAERATAATFADAAAAGEIVFNCTKGEHVLAIMEMAGPNFDGRIVIDLSNPLDFSGGGLPTLFVKDTDSLAEQIQRAHPNARVVKALNTMNCNIMVRPEKVDGDHSVFMYGDDDAAKAAVSSLLQEFGWTTDRIVDLGDLSAARGTEMFLPLWLRIMRSRGSADFNIAVVG